jgi:hypothetical protein
MSEATARALIGLGGLALVVALGILWSAGFKPARAKAITIDIVKFLSVPPRWIVIVLVLLALLLYAAIPEVREWFNQGENRP